MRKNDMENQEAYQIAKKRVEAKIGFYIHGAVYIVVSILLIIINLSTSTQYMWFKWPLLGWGLAVCIHAWSVFVFPEGSTLKEQLIQKEMKKKNPMKK